jgi:hypothetical protein
MCGSITDGPAVPADALAAPNIDDAHGPVLLDIAMSAACTIGIYSPSAIMPLPAAAHTNPCNTRAQRHSSRFPIHAKTLTRRNYSAGDAAMAERRQDCMAIAQVSTGFASDTSFRDQGQDRERWAKAGTDAHREKNLR